MSAIDRLNPSAYPAPDRKTIWKGLAHGALYIGAMAVGFYATARGFGESAAPEALPVRAGEVLAGAIGMTVVSKLAGQEFLAGYRERTLASQVEQPPLPPGEPAE